MEERNHLLDDKCLEEAIVNMAQSWAAIHPYASNETRQRLSDRVVVAVAGIRDRPRG